MSDIVADERGDWVRLLSLDDNAAKYEEMTRDFHRAGLSAKEEADGELYDELVLLLKMNFIICGEYVQGMNSYISGWLLARRDARELSSRERDHGLVSFHCCFVR